MNELLSRPELALGAALAVALAWLALAYWVRLSAARDEVGARLDAMAVPGVVAVPAADRYARFADRDYSGDRGLVPTGPPPATSRWGTVVVPRWTDFYAETVRRLGVDPLGGTR